MANYPYQYRKFPSHKNLLDDVDALHINDIQNELDAVMKTLGLEPNKYVSVEAQTTNFYPSLTLSAGDSGGLEEEVTGPLATYAQVDRNARAGVKTYNSVADRLDNLERGKPNHCFRLRTGEAVIDLPKSAAVDGRPARGIRFPLPTVNNDPFALHNGIGVTLKRSGFWAFNALIVFSLQGTTEQNKGAYAGAIDIDQDWIAGTNRITYSETKKSLFLQTQRMQFVDRGSRVVLRADHDSSVTQNVRLATLAGHMVREND